MRLYSAIPCSILIAACGWSGLVAAEQSSTLVCRSGVTANVAKTEDVLIYTIDHRGIMLSQEPAKIFDNFTQHCVGSIAVVRGKRSGGGYCRNVDPASGDSVLMAWTEGDKAGSGTSTYIGGTGKWKGISGGGEYYLAAATRPEADGTYQNCIRYTDTFTLPKP